jgi:alpha-ketoglutarate-dependent taurine dioxygenase
MTTTSTSTTTATTLDIRPMSGYTGAEIFGVDLREPLAPEVVAEIRRTLLQWKVVFFRDQDLTRAQHIAFGRQFGDVTPAHPTLPAIFPDHPEILLLDNQLIADAESKGNPKSRAPMIESRWHSDVTFVANPPMGSILRGVVVPPYGGDTQFTNLAVAYQQLSEPLQRVCDELHAVHQNFVPIARGEIPGKLKEQFTSKEIRAVHPVVRVHPETGEKILFVNPNFTSHIVELSRRESTHLLALLYEHLSDASFTCRFRWEPGSLAFWDNRATCHLVPTDVPPGMHRSMERITIAGDLPVGVDGKSSSSLSGDAFH